VRSYVNTEEKSIDIVQEEQETMQRSAGTRTDLYTELDSIFRNNNEAWGKE
jgi:hypothetical protein